MSRTVKTKERVSLTLDSGLVARLRGEYPGVPLSRAASHAIRAHLERSDLERRMRSLEIVCRAMLALLADMAAKWDDREGERLRYRYAQKAVSVLRKLEERRARQGAGEGSALPEQAESE